MGRTHVLKTHVVAIGIVLAITAAGGALGEERLPMTCLQLLPAETMQTLAGGGMTLIGAEETRPGESYCTWSDTAREARRVMVSFQDVRGFPPADPTPAGAFAAAGQILERTAAAETVQGIGERAGIFSISANAASVMVQRRDGVLRITGFGLERAELLTLATKAAASPSPMLGDHAPFPEIEPSVPAEAIPLTPALGRLPCVRSLSAREVAAAGRSEVLVNVLNPRSGISLCEWRATSDGVGGFDLIIATREEFTENGFRDADGYFEMERRLLDPSGTLLESLDGLGDEAALYSAGSTVIIVIRRGPEVIKLSCSDCERKEAMGLAEMAIAR